MRALRICRICVYCNLSLGARRGFQRAVTQSGAIPTTAIPLRETTACSGTENLNTHEEGPGRPAVGEQKKRDAQRRVPECSQRSRLKLCVGVRTNFAIQIDLFVSRGRPFHSQVPPGVSMHWTSRG